MELTALQLAVLGLIASMLVELFKIIQKSNPNLFAKVNRKTISAVLFFVSFVLATFWSNSVYPPQATDFAGWVTEIIARLSAIAGVATLLYNILLEKFFEKFNEIVGVE